LVFQYFISGIKSLMSSQQSAVLKLLTGSVFVLFLVCCERNANTAVKMDAKLPDFESAVLSEVEDEFDKVFYEEWAKGKPLKIQLNSPPKRFKEKQIFKQNDSDIKPLAASRLHPLINNWMGAKKPDEMVEVILSVEEYLTIPRFPEPDISKSRNDIRNLTALNRSNEIIRELKDKRRQYNEKLHQQLATLKAKIIEEFWLVPAVRISLPIASIERILSNKRISYIEPVQSSDYPPANANANDDVDDARALLQSDAYFNQDLTAGWIGLLDSGVHRTHELLSKPERIALWRDCTSGNSNCSGGNADDSCWNHGTSAAAIISGNNNQANAQRGVSGIMVDSWKVYPDSTDATGNCNGGLNTAATLRAFEQAVLWFDKIIVAEMQGSGDEYSSISKAADAAFDTGSAVIAANGNKGPGAGTVSVPAIAHRVIGVGAFDTQTANQYANQSRGPANDNRIKPDIQTPNNSETASTGCGFGSPCTPLSDTANRNFGGTSGAVPYAGAIAALARNWMRKVGQTDPGHVYARLIVSGQISFPFNNTSGAGPVRMPVNGYSWWGKVAVEDGEAIEIPINVSRATANNLDAAIWWPEKNKKWWQLSEKHNDIDLRIVSPVGVVNDSSLSISSVFERVRASGGVAAGIWKLRISGYSVGGSAQTVYYNATVRN